MLQCCCPSCWLGFLPGCCLTPCCNPPPFPRPLPACHQVRLVLPNAGPSLFYDPTVSTAQTGIVDTNPVNNPDNAAGSLRTRVGVVGLSMAGALCLLAMLL